MKRRGRPENPELTVNLQDNEISVTSIDTQKSKRTISFTTIMEGEK
jgi:hypothetical protein